MICKMLSSFYRVMLQNSEAHFKNDTALDSLVIFLTLIRWFLSFLLKSGVEVIVFVSLSVRLFQRRGPREDIANLVALKYILGSMKLFLLCLVGL